MAEDASAAPGADVWRARALPLLVVLGVEIVHTALPAPPWLRLVSSTVLFGFAVFSVANSRPLRIVAGLLLVLAFTARVAFLAESSEAWLIASQASAAALLLFTALALVPVVYGRDHQRTERLSSALAVYLLLGFVWASVYSLLEVLQPGAVRFPEDPSTLGAEYALSPFRFLYFSFVTLTTVGYGDASPVLPLARALAVIEALTGQLFLAVTIASLVNERTSSTPAR
jgi:voltage-gated potassium channel Kch